MDSRKSLEQEKAVQKSKPPTCHRNLKYYFWEFCSSTSIHGFHRLGEKGRPFPEKIWWIIAILIAMYLCTSLIHKTYQKWMYSPVIVTFASSQTAIWEIPFPAVTICPEIKATKDKFNYTDVYIRKGKRLNVTDQETIKYDYLSLVCGYGVTYYNESLKFVDEKAIEFLKEVTPDFNETLSLKFWNGRRFQDITEIFSPILTINGVCYTFNALDKSELFRNNVTFPGDFFSTYGKTANWFVDRKLPTVKESDARPRRSFTSGLRGGLTLSFGIIKDDLDYICGHAMHGFKGLVAVSINGVSSPHHLQIVLYDATKKAENCFSVFLHNPAEVPTGGDTGFNVPLDHSVFAAVKPTMMTTSTDLLIYKPQERQCYFNKEKILKYFNIYNQRNCLSECLVDYTLQKCGCVWFNMPRTNSTKICSVSQFWCVEDARYEYFLYENNETSQQATKILRCDCLPSCNSLEFDVELSQVKWHWKPRYEIRNEVEPFQNTKQASMHWSQLAVFFKEMQFITSERNELFGQTDFWANCGGLLGLFIGFSFISALEILYYLTIRVFCNVYLFGKGQWSGFTLKSYPSSIQKSDE